MEKDRIPALYPSPDPKRAWGSSNGRAKPGSDRPPRPAWKISGSETRLGDEHRSCLDRRRRSPEKTSQRRFEIVRKSRRKKLPGGAAQKHLQKPGSGSIKKRARYWGQGKPGGDLKKTSLFSDALKETGWPAWPVRPTTSDGQRRMKTNLKCRNWAYTRLSGIKPPVRKRKSAGP